MKVALVYDRVNKWGGAERVLLALHKIFPEAPLYTSVYDEKLAPWAKDFKVNTSFIQKLPIPKNAHEYYPFLMGIAFETFNFDEYDVVISVTSEFAKSIITKPATLHICLCLNPVGYLWNANKNYFSDKNAFFKFIAGPIVRWLRFYDLIVSKRPDKYISISKAVSQRIKQYYGFESLLIYPPVGELSNATSSVTQFSDPWFNDGKYYLAVARLVPNKRLDILIEAFNTLGDRLVIIGVGKQEQYLKNLAKDNIKFVGLVTDEQLSHYYAHAKALVVPGEEDFGIVMVEAQQFGLPVIAFGQAGALEIVTPKTGWLFENQTSEDIIKIINKTRNLTVDPLECKRNAQRFSQKVFGEKIRDYIISQYNGKRN